ncbi:MAG: glycosyltransferase family 39 protein [Solirubrobacterales bacterium]|nr:glycosyltransferase family 39 protein [Solirubrobacterales bacterium]
MSVGTLARDARRPEASVTALRARAIAAPVPAAIVGLTLLGAILRFTRLGHQGYWFDEANTALLVHFSPGKMIGLIPQTESTPPLYYCLAWVWARIFGYGEAGLRSLSALAGVATVPLAYGAGAKLISRRTGVIAAALTACNPLLIWYSQEARAYSLLVALSAAALLAFAYVRTAPTGRNVTAWVLCSALAMSTHYYALLAIVPEAVWLLALHRRRRVVQMGVGAAALCGLALVPLAISQNGTGHASWIAPIPLGARLRQLLPQSLIGTGAPAQQILEPLAAALAVLAIVLALARSERLERNRALAVGSLAVAGLVLNLLLIAAGIDDLITRNVIALWLPAALLVAGGLGARRAGALGAAAATALCAIGVTAAVGVALDRSLQRPDWRGVARVLGSRPPAGVPARAILVQHYRDLLPLSLYLPRLKFVRGSAVRVSELDVVSISAPRVALCWWGAACNLSPSTLQRSYPVPGFRQLWVKHVYQFTVMRLVSSRPVALTGAVISAALETTTLRRDELLVQRR